MKKIVSNVFYEDSYPGVVLGVVTCPKGILMIDVPLLPDDILKWKDSLAKLKAGRELMLINLDSHTDRTLGAKAVGGTLVTHTHGLEVFDNRPAVFKVQPKDSGSEWESYNGLSGIRWKCPEIAFSDRMVLNWGIDVIIEHHPGPDPGASWVVIPKLKVVFVGDTVISKQPPFLGNAEIAPWVESLDLLLSEEYDGYKIISGRSGKVNEKDIKNLKKLLGDLKKRLDKLGKRKAPAQDTEKFVEKLVGASGSPARQKKTHTQRAKYGLFHYYTNNYLPSVSKGRK